MGVKEYKMRTKVAHSILFDMCCRNGICNIGKLNEEINIMRDWARSIGINDQMVLIRELEDVRDFLLENMPCDLEITVSGMDGFQRKKELKSYA